jgi:hypothetical protein
MPVVTTDPYALDTLSDPLPFHQQLREAGPVVRLERYGIWGMARYEQVAASLRNFESFSSASGAGLSDFRKETPWRTPSLLLEADPPQHTRARQIVGPLLTLRALENWRKPWQLAAEALVDRLVALGTFDAVPDFAEAYSLAVFADAVGLPEEGRENLLPYGHMVFNGFGPRNELLAEAMACAEQVQTWIAASCRREILHPGGFGTQIYASVDVGKITEQEAALLVRSLLSAGLDTTVNTLVAALFAFGPIQTSGGSCERISRSSLWRLKRCCAGSRQCRHSSAPRPETWISQERTFQRERRCCSFSGRRTAIRGIGTTRIASMSRVMRRGTLAWARASISVLGRWSPDCKANCC